MRIIKKIIFGIIVFFFVELYIDSNFIEVTNINVGNKKVPACFDGFKILHLSDLHNKRFGRNNSFLINKINKINPDIIVMTGDMVNCTSKNFDNFFDFVKVASKKYNMYYVVGNHEESINSNKRNVLLDFLSTNNVKILNNENTVIEKNGEKINLYGCWCNLKYYSSSKEIEKNEFDVDVMKSIMKSDNADSELFNILLAHNPNFIETYSNWGADLTLSGHIHGGMVRLPFIGAIFSPDSVVFPKYSEGLYKVNGKDLVVSRGLGRGVTGFRFFNRPELVVIELKNKGA